MAGDLTLTDGGIETRLMFDPEVRLDPHVQVAGMLDDPVDRGRLAEVYRSYLAVGTAAGIGMIIGTPTFRASRRYTEAAGLGGDDAVARLNRDAVAFHQELRDGCGHSPVRIAGVIGPAGDAYQPTQALEADVAVRYHRIQAEALADAGADVLYAPTFPSVEEAVGVVRAMTATGKPAVVSFVLGGDGRILDGTSIDEAVDRIDAERVAPESYSLSCIHPSLALRALDDAEPDARARVRELKANASSLPPAELVDLDHMAGDDPETWADGMWSVRQAHGLDVLGGCCGTDDRHIRALAARLAAER